MRFLPFQPILLGLFLSIAYPLQLAAEQLGDLTYTISDGEVTITQCDYNATSAAVPAEIDGLPVTTIGDAAFNKCLKLHNISLPATVTTIGVQAFSPCDSLTSISVDPANLAFTTRNDLLLDKGETTVLCCPGGYVGIPDIPDGITTIAEKAFFYCKNITSTRMPDTITRIGSSAFFGCGQLSEIVIPEGITAIEHDTFNQCSNLTLVSLPSNLLTIDFQAFYACRSLAISELPDSIVSIGKSAFNGCGRMTLSVLPASLENLSERAFQSSGIALATLPPNLTTIPLRAFSMCRNISNLSIPETVESIGESAFEFCMSLADVSLSPGLKSVGSGAFYSCRSLGSIDLPEGLTYLGSGALSSCPRLESAITPSTLTTFEDGVFGGCSSLTTVTIHGNVLRFGENTFSGCSSLGSIVIPEGATSIGYRCFLGCSSLPSVTLPSTLTLLGRDVFDGCSSLATIDVAAPNPFFFSADGVLYAKNEMKLLTCPQAWSGALRIPDGVITIPKYALVSCTALTHAVIPASVTSLGYQAFGGCSALMTVEFLGNAPDVARRPFRTTPGMVFVIQPGATGFTFPTWEGHLVTYPGDFETVDLGSAIEITGHSTAYGDLSIPPSIEAKPVTRISASAFAKEPGISALSLPSQISDIGLRAFADCKSLKTIAVEPSNPVFSSLNGVLYNKEQTKLIACPAGLVGRFILPESVTAIADHAFEGCSGLTGITLPAALGSIGASSFSGCDGLADISFHGDAPSVGPDAFAFSALNFSFRFYRNKGFTTPSWHGHASMLEEVFFHTDLGSSIEISGHNSPRGRLSIPSRSNGKPVVSVAAGAFNGSQDLISIRIPASVSRIGANAFADCTKLSRAIFLGDAPTLGKSAFPNQAPFKINYRDTKAGFSWPKWQGYHTQPVGREIAVFQPAARSLTDGKATKNFGRSAVGKTGRSLTFTIRNIGTTKLSKIRAVASGADRKDFIVSKLKRTALNSDQRITFRVTFKPRKEGKRNAKLIIRSNDSNERPFDIRLGGIGR